MKLFVSLLYTCTVPFKEMAKESRHKAKSLLSKVKKELFKLSLQMSLLMAEQDSSLKD